MNDETPDVATVADALNRLAIYVVRLSSQDQLSLSAASTLGRLRRLGALRLTELAERERITQPSMTALVNRLESQGFVRRAPDPRDGRAVLVELAEPGRIALAERSKARVGTLVHDLDDLSDHDLALLQQALQAIEQLIAAHPLGR
jgi:DNA-binding MarR family transcriptional regulator